MKQQDKLYPQKKGRTMVELQRHIPYWIQIPPGIRPGQKGTFVIGGPNLNSREITTNAQVTSMMPDKQNPRWGVLMKVATEEGQTLFVRSDLRRSNGICQLI